MSKIQIQFTNYTRWRDLNKLGHGLLIMELLCPINQEGGKTIFSQCNKQHKNIQFSSLLFSGFPLFCRLCRNYRFENIPSVNEEKSNGSLDVEGLIGDDGLLASVVGAPFTGTASPVI